MPEISPIGWFHTVLGIIAITSGITALVKYKELTLYSKSGQTYLGATFVTAVTALAIYAHGTFNAAHVLAILTLLALVTGFMANGTQLFGGLSRYVRAIAWSATLLFHSIPAITDGLLRLPVGNPVLTSIEDPVLKKSYLVLLVIFLIGITLQLRWIRGRSRTV